MTLWAVMLLVSMGGVVGTVICSRKKKYNNK